VYLAGEHCTMMGGWMAGALESARSVVEAVHARVQKG
jgi:monoamine oxidase